MYGSRIFPAVTNNTDTAANLAMAAGDPAPVRLLHLDADLCAVWKPSGLPVLPDRTGDTDLRMLLREQAGLPTAEAAHRLDRPVSGVVLFALKRQALTALNAAFAKGAVRKTYLAIVHGRVDGPQVLEGHLDHDPHKRRARVAVSSSARRVRLTIQPVKHGERYTLVRVEPDGGAFHQIRAQLAMAGHPIKGDVKYGARRGEGDRSIALHALMLDLKHPVGLQHLHIQAPPPTTTIWQRFLDPLQP